MPDHVTYAAVQIAMADASRRADVGTIESVLMRFHCNQFSFSDNGAAEHDPAFYASAVYSFISRTNHSCAPNMAMLFKQNYRKLHAQPFSMAQDGGIKMAIAARDIKKGERLTFCYEPSIVSYSLHLQERDLPPATS